MGARKIRRENDICDSIIQYGKDILNSDVFRQSASEKHHLHGTVFDHTINVCAVSLRLGNQLKRRGVEVREKDLIQAALCHDLGMISREEKYSHRMESWTNHAQESARIARELIPDMSQETEDMILSHMWPVAGPTPSSNEAIILCIADKYASMADWRSWLTKHRYVSRIKDQLEAEQKNKYEG